MLRGENIEIDFSSDGDPTLMGFYATRWVNALSPTKAELKAVEMLKNEFHPKLKKTAELTPGAVAMIYLEEIEVVKRKPWRRRNGGASWFPMKEK